MVSIESFLFNSLIFKQRYEIIEWQNAKIILIGYLCATMFILKI